MTFNLKFSFARLAHALTLRVARPNPHGMLRLCAAHADSTLPPASLAPTQCPRLGHVAATNSMKAMALRAAGVSMASGLALCAPAARQSRSDLATSSRSRNRYLAARNRMSCGDFRNRAREHDLVTSAFWSMTDGSVMGKVARLRVC